MHYTSTPTKVAKNHPKEIMASALLELALTVKRPAPEVTSPYELDGRVSDAPIKRGELHAFTGGQISQGRSWKQYLQSTGKLVACFHLG